jgi:oxygen-independent coproporphyrinogen-3 oxidase
MTNKGLYVHIPFCSHICSYCDFCKIIFDQKYVKPYLNRLKEELEHYQIKQFSSIYIGGGTPSSLKEEDLEELLKMLKPYLEDNKSFAFEANFENLTLSKIQILKKYGVNRVSLGLQTFDQNLLKILNRHHDEKLVDEVLFNLHNEGIDDINIDLIYGLPNQSLEMVKKDVEKLVSKNITHISTYALSVVPHTLFYVNKVKEVSQETYREYYDYIVEALKEHGFNRYEVSNFAKEGYESKHNLIYWRNEEYLGIGLGAASYLNNKRFSNTKSLTKYLQGTTVEEEEELSKKDKEFYSLMLGLRLEEGVSLKKFKELYQEDLVDIYKEPLKELEERRLIQILDGRLKVTEENFFILDYVLEKLLF